MKRILVVVLIVVLLPLTSCSKDLTEDKEGFVDYLFSEEQSEYSEAYISISFEENYYVYSYEIRQDLIRVYYDLNDGLITKLYHDQLGTMTSEVYTKIDDELISKLTIEMSSEEFIAEYIDITNVRLNVDYNQIDTYNRREEDGGYWADTWTNFFDFNDDYILNVSIFELDIEISGLRLRLSSLKEVYNSDGLVFNGYDSSYLYEIIIDRRVD